MSSLVFDEQGNVGISAVKAVGILVFKTCFPALGVQGAESGAPLVEIPFEGTKQIAGTNLGCVLYQTDYLKSDLALFSEEQEFLYKEN